MGEKCEKVGKSDMYESMIKQRVVDARGEDARFASKIKSHAWT